MRDSLSLLDRALLVENEGNEINLKTAQTIFGYFEKSIIIDLLGHIVSGSEEKTLSLYKKTR